MTNENINELIAKYLSGESNPEEAMQLEDWKNSDSNNAKYFSQTEQLYYANNNEFQSLNKNFNKTWEKISTEINTDKKVISLFVNARKTWLAIAASVTLIISIGVVVKLLMANPNEERIAYKTNSETMNTRLSDGSEIKLDLNSELIVDKDFDKGKRTLYLKGSASFSVTHDDAKPFIVDVGNVFIKDIGTKFSIKLSLDTDSVYVNVDEGVVLLFDSLKSTLEIKATESAIYIKSKKQIVTPTEIKKLNDKILNFNKTTLKEVVATLNDKYQTNVKLENTRLESCIITVNFNDEKIETALDVITQTLGLTFIKTENGFLIKGTSCKK